jgi:hypothetical protein
MTGKIEERIERLLQAGKKKREVWQELREEEEPHKLLFFLNNSSRPKDRGKYQVLNLILVAVLVFITAKKLIAAFAFGQFDLWLLMMLVVPAINLYVLKEILRFRKIGYQFLFVLSLLALLQPENHFLQEATLLAIMIGLSGFLYLKLFPARDVIRMENR